MKSTFPGAIPEIPVKDITQAAAYYESSLGFTLDWGGDGLGLAGISNGNCRMFLANSEYRKKYGNVGPVLTWLNLESKEEVDDLSARSSVFISTHVQLVRKTCEAFSLSVNRLSLS
ncbi:MAG: hypothetical protein ABR555_17070 [Pyrinomonadaceae bacterium]